MGIGSGVNASISISHGALETFENILFFGGEDSCRFDNIIGSLTAPFDLARFLLIEDLDTIIINEKLSILRLDCAIEATMNRVKVEQISLKTNVRSV
jgi:hypothetical protein